MGMPLARVPMIETAFDLLRLLDRRIDIQDIGRALRWISGALVNATIAPRWKNVCATITPAS